MARRYNKLAVLAKVETTYGTSAAPTGAANAMLVSNVTVTPLEGDEVSRDLMLPYFGDQGMVLAGVFARIQFSVEIAGAGAAGTAPNYGPLLRACSMSETITATTKVEYKPVSSTPEAVTLFANLDGVNHAMVGARGTVTLALAPKTIPKFTFTMTGMLGPIGDVPLPAATVTGFQKPLVGSKANSAFVLHGLAAVLESLNLDLGNQIEPRMLIGAETIEVVDRKASGTAVIEAVSAATKDWFGIARASTLGGLLATHGTVAGNIFEIEAAAVQIGKPAYGNTQGITNHSLPLKLIPVTGDDEVTFRVR
ncbi:phage tail tube protein [Methylobacterium sp. Leaf85]|uniref:phage tail tube protein n=1 Tax=Methylobacterium sp. Leaf85 TaxID=1736241 RepID=UPI0006FCAF43|nr:phage tail tube protein [Methylobacterium sp. Leaf85]KQO53070.1 hypothetical protein ASF08_19285 [Methylobacterium sp. Leaf85]